MSLIGLGQAMQLVAEAVKRVLWNFSPGCRKKHTRPPFLCGGDKGVRRGEAWSSTFKMILTGQLQGAERHFFIFEMYVLTNDSFVIVFFCERM